MANHNPPAKAFKKGNQFYKSAITGRKKLFDTPAHLWQAACTYFEHCTDDLVEVWSSKRGKLIIEYKMRPMSWRGLYLYLGVGDLKYYKNLEEFSEIVSRIDSVIYVHNYSCAVTGILNGRMISATL